MATINEEVTKAVLFIEQIEQEFSDLIHSYHIGSPRSDGIWVKVNGVKSALAAIETEIRAPVVQPPVPLESYEPSAPETPPEPLGEPDEPYAVKRTRKK